MTPDETVRLNHVRKHPNELSVEQWLISLIDRLEAENERLRPIAEVAAAFPCCCAQLESRCMPCNAREALGRKEGETCE